MKILDTERDQIVKSLENQRYVQRYTSLRDTMMKNKHFRGSPTHTEGKDDFFQADVASVVGWYDEVSDL